MAKYPNKEYMNEKHRKRESVSESPKSDFPRRDIVVYIFIFPFCHPTNKITMKPPMTDLSYTMVESRYNCSEVVYYFHITLCYIVILMGILAFLSRVVPRLLPYHEWFGRGFITFMFWVFGTSLLIHNTGLPLAILIFFLFLLVCISIGWNVIRIHSKSLQHEAEKKVDSKIKENKEILQTISVPELVTEAKQEIAASKTVWQRFFSLKALHGFCMAFAWYQLFGRAFTVNPGDDFSCYTYPAYKNPSDESRLYVPLYDDDWEDRSTGGFVAMVALPGIFFFLAVGLAVSFYGARKDKKRNETDE